MKPEEQRIAIAEAMPYTPTKEEIRLRELAEEYHRTCEDYDRTICTGTIKDGAIMPATNAEVSAISRHAQAVRDDLWRHVAPLGFSRQQWMEAIRDEGRRYRRSAKYLARGAGLRIDQIGNSLPLPASTC